ncbi:MAG: glycosyltransferase family 2 protein [Planctomyces sp.]
MPEPLKLSLVIPAHNEAKNIGKCLDELRSIIVQELGVPYELIVVNDNSSDDTAAVIQKQAESDPFVRIVTRSAPPGFGRAIRAGLEEVTGEVTVIYMADLSDSPSDVVNYYHKILEGFDCVYGSRFIPGSIVENYPQGKLMMNRIVNRLLKILFWTEFNDLTNAFKAYRTEVIRDCGPYLACHFNITIEMSLGALIRDYRITQIPIQWHGRTWGSSKLSLFTMGRRYLSTLIMMLCQHVLISDDLQAERRSRNEEYNRQRRSAGVER